MCYINENKIQKEEYKNILQAIGAFSNLFSESEKAYLNYRVHENSYCQAFEADNLSRSDIAVDAKKNNVGIGLKTFLRGKDNTWQKVAEFNRLSANLIGKTTDEKIELIKFWRNERLNTSIKLYGLDIIIYHCVVRDSEGFHIFEEEMKFIGDTSNHIEDEKTIKFSSNGEEYNFNKSKSTLLKRFYTSNILETFEVSPLDNPFEVLKGINLGDISSVSHDYEEVVIPLYSVKDGKVQEKSGLNQWNAGGRPRDCNEVYIPISRAFHKENPDFFPPKDTSFILMLPNGEQMSAKLCQSESKALMSNPNKALGKWILRDILNLKEGELLTREMLQIKGFDSIIVCKVKEGYYKLDVYIENESNKE